MHAAGVAADLSHINTRSTVSGHLDEDMDKALAGAHTVVIAAGMPRKPHITQEMSFEVNARIFLNFAEGVAKNCPNAFVLVISDLLNSMVPVVCEVLKKHGVFDPKKVFGITTLDVVRSSKFASEVDPSIDPKNTRVTVLGGHSGDTIVPLLSQIPGQKFANDQLKNLTYRIQHGDDEVFKAKDSTGSATLSMAHAGARFTNAVLSAAVLGTTGLIESAYVHYDADIEATDFEIEYFAHDIELGREEVERILPLPSVSYEEKMLLSVALVNLRGDITKGTKYVTES
ncbi:Malate dehydrogenase, cytoplasmic [Podila epigama]|nr:Malate dehydrogenase, cytoplasmic [Podila epigama]